MINFYFHGHWLRYVPAVGLFFFLFFSFFFFFCSSSNRVLSTAARFSRVFNGFPLCGAGFIPPSLAATLFRSSEFVSLVNVCECVCYFFLRSFIRNCDLYLVECLVKPCTTRFKLARPHRQLGQANQNRLMEPIELGQGLGKTLGGTHYCV